MHKKMIGDEDDGDEDHDKDGSYKTPPQQQQQHFKSEQIDRSCLRMWQPLPIGFGGGGSFAINRFNIKDAKKHER